MLIYGLDLETFSIDGVHAKLNPTQSRAQHHASCMAQTWNPFWLDLIATDDRLGFKERFLAAELGTR